MLTKDSPAFLLLCTALGLAFLFALGYSSRGRFLRGENDFLQLYSGAALVGTPDLYSIDANIEVHQQAIGNHIESVYYTRPPFYALLLEPLARLPYRTAYAIHQLASAAAIVLFVYWYLPGFRELALFASLSIPLLSTFLGGQDVTLALLAAAGSIHLHRQGREQLSGVALALGAIKFHLFSLVALAVILQRQWRVLRGALAGGAVLIALSYAGGGGDWPRRYLELLRDPRLHPGPQIMPNINGIVHSWELGGMPLVIAASVFTILLAGWLAWRAESYEMGFAWTLVGGILVSYHAYVQDCTVLLLALAIVAQRSTSSRLRGMMALLVSPLPYLLVFLGPPYNIVLPTMLFAVLVFAAIETRSSRIPAAQAPSS